MIINYKKLKFFTAILIVGFVVCSFSFNVVHANEVKKSHHHSHQTNQSDQISHASGHHLLTQPDVCFTAILLPPSDNLDDVETLKNENLGSTVEIINNQGAPPLDQPLKTGIVNTKVW